VFGMGTGVAPPL